MKAYIYCIYNNKFKRDFYIGSSKKYKKRMIEHKSNCYNPNSPKHNYKVYKFIRNNGGWSNWSHIIIAIVDVKDKLEKRQIEQVYIDHLKPGLNDKRSYQTPEQLKEWQNDYIIKNREQLKEYQNDYRIKNREQIKELQNKKMNCICGGKYTNKHKARHGRSKKHQNYLLNTTQTITKINI